MRNAFAYKTEGHRHRPEIEQELAALGSPVEVTFVPHLLPLDQGELTSCYVRTSESLSKAGVQALYRERYREEPFIRVVDRPPALRDVRDTNECHIHVTVEERGRVLAFFCDRQSLEGGIGAGHSKPQPNVGSRGERGVEMSARFFHSRWVTAPVGAEELDPAKLAPGFRAGGAHCGLKQGGRTDVGLLVCDAPNVSSALLLTRNASAAAPVRVCRDRCERGAIRAAVVNSGNANAETGAQGYADALSMRAEAAARLDLVPETVAVAETGTIGVQLPIDAILGAIGEAAAGLSGMGGATFSDSITTTDRWPKRCTLRSNGVTLSRRPRVLE